MSKSVEHWNNIYETKGPSEVSWTEDYPSYSIEFIESLSLDKSLPIIDIGGGDSRVVDSLLELGFDNITVLDISENALNRAKLRLGKISNKIEWISCDILNFKPKKTYIMKAGDVHFYDVGHVHSPVRKYPVRLLRIEGANLDNIKRSNIKVIT